MPQSLTDIQMVLAPVFAAYGISRAVLFGSVAKGTATEKSDLDLLVDSKLQGLKFVGFMEAVRQAVGMPVDIFDVRHKASFLQSKNEICGLVNCLLSHLTAIPSSCQMNRTNFICNIITLINNDVISIEDLEDFSPIPFCKSLFPQGLIPSVKK